MLLCPSVSVVQVTLNTKKFKETLLSTLGLGNKEVILEKKSFRVPAEYNGVVPIYAGEEIAYSVKEIVSSSDDTKGVI